MTTEHCGTAFSVVTNARSACCSSNIEIACSVFCSARVRWQRMQKT